MSFAEIPRCHELDFLFWTRTFEHQVRSSVYSGYSVVQPDYATFQVGLVACPFSILRATDGAVCQTTIHPCAQISLWQRGQSRTLLVLVEPGFRFDLLG